MNPQTFSFPVSSYRKLPNPYGDEINSVVYECYVEIQNIPNNFPMETNPREQNIKTMVARSIINSLTQDEENFHIKNRGIVISAQKVSFDSRNSEVTITMNNNEVHGNIDGGHTYRIILENRKNVQFKQYVKLEIITGAEDFFQDLAKARNTSVQVKDTSIAELENKFELIKECLSNILDDIAFKENDDKRINIEDIISILYMFNLSEFSSIEKQPTRAYSQKAYCIKNYIKLYDEFNSPDKKKEDNPFYKMKNIIPEILDLYDYIECNLQKKYKEEEPKGKYGGIKGVQTKKEGSNDKFETEIYGTKIDYKSPRSFTLPILSAFRALVEEGQDGSYRWKDDPKKYFDNFGGQMIKDTRDRSQSLGNNPNALGKDTGHWKAMFNIIDGKYKDKLIEELTQGNNK